MGVTMCDKKYLILGFIKKANGKHQFKAANKMKYFEGRA